MSEKIIRFRTAAFGGFQRQDVVDYVESAAKEHAQQLRELREELKQTQARAEAADELEAQLEAVTAQRDELEAQLAAQAALEEEVAALRAQVAQLQPDADSFRQLKGTLADIELDARRRSAAIIEEAEASAQEMKAKASALLSRISEEFNRSKLNTNSTLDNLIQQLTQMRSSLTGLAQAIQSGEDAIAEAPRHE